MTDVKRLAPVISCHAWNGDGTKLAICPNNNEIHVYAKVGNDYKFEHKLTEHDQLVTGIDWAPKTNRIVSCSQDRNAYVWTLDGNQWKPVLVILRIERAATNVKWSPQENKFAVASGAKRVSVCYFEEDNNWWVSKHIKKHLSTVTQVSWHPNNIWLATVSTDFKARIFSGYIKNVDGKSKPPSLYDKKPLFGEMFAEIDGGGWLQACRWSPSGNLLAFVGQDSCVYVADVSGPNQPAVTKIPFNGLPFADLVFLDEGKLIAAGHDCTPVSFVNSGGWKLGELIDKNSGEAKQTAPGQSTQKEAFKVFQSKVDKGQETVVETVLATKHQNCITCVSKVGGQYCTTGIDGMVILWK